jgi:hypothetical protein
MTQDQQQRMNRKRVITWMTVGVGVIFLMMTFILLGALPPWPVWVFFGISHGFFCVAVWRVRPYRGPFLKPMPDATVPARRPDSRS